MALQRVEDAYRRLHPRLWRALLAYTGDRDTASDAEAEAFTQALRRGHGIDDLDAWLWRSALRIAAGLIADRRARMAEQVGFIDIAVDDDGSVVEFMSQLDGLSDQQRAVVVLRYVGGMRPTEIADLLHSTPGSVRVQLHRAHEHLRVSMEEHHGR